MPLSGGIGSNRGGSRRREMAQMTLDRRNSGAANPYGGGGGGGGFARAGGMAGLGKQMGQGSMGGLDEQRRKTAQEILAAQVAGGSMGGNIAKTGSNSLAPASQQQAPGGGMGIGSTGSLVLEELGRAQRHQTAPGPPQGAAGVGGSGPPMVRDFTAPGPPQRADGVGGNMPWGNATFAPPPLPPGGDSAGGGGGGQDGDPYADMTGDDLLAELAAQAMIDALNGPDMSEQFGAMDAAAAAALGEDLVGARAQMGRLGMAESGAMASIGGGLRAQSARELARDKIELEQAEKQRLIQNALDAAGIQLDVTQLMNDKATQDELIKWLTGQQGGDGQDNSADGGRDPGDPTNPDLPGGPRDAPPNVRSSFIDYITGGVVDPTMGAYSALGLQPNITPLEDIPDGAFITDPKSVGAPDEDGYVWAYMVDREGKRYTTKIHISELHKYQQKPQGR